MVTGSLHLPPGTSHDWRLRCGAVDLYFTLFGLSRPSCLPLPELGLVLNLKEKKAVLNPTIIPEAVAGSQEATSNPGSHAPLAGFPHPVRAVWTPGPGPGPGPLPRLQPRPHGRSRLLEPPQGLLCRAGSFCALPPSDLVEAWLPAGSLPDGFLV